MYTLEKATEQLFDFMESDERCVLITGTHQYEKHPLAFRIINKNVDSSRILFRVNGMDNVGTFLKKHDRSYKTGTKYKFGHNHLYIDSMNSRTWSKTPGNINCSVLYPLDSVTRTKSRESIIEDLFRRTHNKIFLVSWTDNWDFSWTDSFVDRHVIYDAEEENPAYHKRVIDLINNKG